MGFPVNYRTHDHTVYVHTAWSMCSSCTRSPCSFRECSLSKTRFIWTWFISLVRLQKWDVIIAWDHELQMTWRRLTWNDKCMGGFSSCWCVCLIPLSVYHRVQSLSIERGSHWLNQKCLWSSLSGYSINQYLVLVLILWHQSQALFTYDCGVENCCTYGQLCGMVYMIAIGDNACFSFPWWMGHLWLLSTQICLPERWYCS